MCRAGVEPGSLVRYKPLPVFCGDEGQSALGHPFRRRLDFRRMHITLDGIASTLLKNLAPLHNEKECSTRFLQVFGKKEGKLHDASAS